jgi:DNA-binding NtrC family response regulator
VQSEKGKGTTFEMYLPVASSEAATDAEDPEPLPRGTEKILFVDDEPMLADISKKILESIGYQVAICTTSNEAFTTFTKDPAAFDAVITDYTMPHMTGLELAQELIRIRPDLPVILCTGYSDAITQAKATAVGICEFIVKPLKTHELAKTLRAVFDREKA